MGIGAGPVLLPEAGRRPLIDQRAPGAIEEGAQALQDPRLETHGQGFGERRGKSQRSRDGERSKNSAMTARHGTLLADGAGSRPHGGSRPPDGLLAA